MQPKKPKSKNLLVFSFNHENIPTSSDMRIRGAMHVAQNRRTNQSVGLLIRLLGVVHHFAPVPQRLLAKLYYSAQGLRRNSNRGYNYVPPGTFQHFFFHPTHYLFFSTQSRELIIPAFTT